MKSSGGVLGGRARGLGAGLQDVVAVAELAAADAQLPFGSCVGGEKASCPDREPVRAGNFTHSRFKIQNSTFSALPTSRVVLLRVSVFPILARKITVLALQGAGAGV